MSRRRSWRKRRAERCRILAARCAARTGVDHDGPYREYPTVRLVTHREFMDAVHLVRAGGYCTYGDFNFGATHLVSLEFA